MAKRKAYWLLVVPFVATLLPFFYNQAEPSLFGMPFFYWYQLGWVPLTGGLLGLVVFLTREAPPKAKRRSKDV